MGAAMIDQVWKRLQLMTQSCKVEMLNRENGKHHLQAKGLDGEVLGNIEHIQPYGFSHSPHAGSQAHVIFPGGDRSYGIAFVVGDKQYNMSALKGGEVAVHDHAGNYVLIGEGGVITVKSSTKVIADTPLFECTQNCKIGGDLEVVGGVTSRGKDISDTHSHQDNGAGPVN
jgi:phage baseplate assembly protein V